jgi:subtilisin-like proprotein convertase family protein
MKASRSTAVWTFGLFLVTVFAPAFPVNARPGPASDETTRLVKEADEAYQSGKFELAIEKYQKAMQLIGEKKEMAQTKQELFQTMTSLALTYFTIQENAKAERQLQDLIQVNPNQELDPEFYPPKFLAIFRGVQKSFLGRLSVASIPNGAAVFLGSDALGSTPLRLEKVLKGKYELKAELAGYAPVSREIVVQADAETMEELKLEPLRRVVEKSQPPAQAQAKKKKKLSPLVIAGGVVVAAAAVLLLTGKKTPNQKELRSLTFTQNSPVPIDLLLPTYITMDVAGVQNQIERVEYRVVISHQNHMEDLVIHIFSTDARTSYTIWNRGQSTAQPTVIAGTSDAFNATAPNGTWRLVVQNPGHNPGGEIREFMLRIFYFQ